MSRSEEFTKGQLVGHVTCDQCGEKHPAEYSHIGGYDTKRPYFAVVCPKDNLTDYYDSTRIDKP